MLDVKTSAGLDAILSGSVRVPLAKSQDRMELESRLSAIETSVQKIADAVVSLGLTLDQDRRSRKCEHE